MEYCTAAEMKDNTDKIINTASHELRRNGYFYHWKQNNAID